MTTLSPAAQAVLDATGTTGTPLELAARGIAAATLRAAADQTRPEIHIEDIDHVHQNYVDGWKDALYMIIDIAAELENAND